MRARLTAPVAREGWPFIGMGLAVAAVGWALSLAPLGWAGVSWVLACAAFFRNPTRDIPATAGAVVSPADGRVLSLTQEDDPYFQRGPMQRLTIFLSVANVHINRVPSAGIVRGVKYARGRFRMAFAPEASTENERNAIWISGQAVGGDDCIFVQIAGLIARRIVCYLREGDTVARGERFGLIRFGSRMDVYLPLHYRMHVGVGDRVRGGATIIAQAT